MSFRLKTILGIAVIEALLLSILVVGGLQYLRTSNERQLLQRAHSTAKLVATMTGDAVIATDLASLDVFVEQTLINDDIVFLRIRSESGQILAEGGNGAALATPFREDTSIAEAGDPQRLAVQAPIAVGGTRFGSVELALSTAGFHATIDAAFQWMAGIALSEMILVALAGSLLGTYLTRQLLSLMAGAKQVATGDFGHQIAVKGRDELADTAISFNKMSTALQRYAEMAESARRQAEFGRQLAENTLHDALNSMRDGVLICDPDEKIVMTNSALRSFYELENASPTDVPSLVALQASAVDTPNGNFVDERLRMLRDPAGHARWETTLADGRRLLVAQHMMANGGIVVLETDVTELYRVLDENRKLQLERLQRHKTEALATLARGMAHELNTPAQFISDNLGFLSTGFTDIQAALEALSEQAKSGKQISAEHYLDTLEEMDWDFVRKEIPHALAEIKNGTIRIGDLTTTFKQFTAPESSTRELTDLADAIRTTLEISKSEWSGRAEIEIDADAAVPLIECHRAQIGQVLHNLVINAVHAIEDCNDGRTGRISVRLAMDNDTARVDIRDNGCGIDTQTCDRIFDALYTTKAPGRGTGHGLALCQSIVVGNHCGSIDVQSEPGSGTCFTLKLPLRQHKAAA